MIKGLIQATLEEVHLTLQDVRPAGQRGRLGLDGRDSGNQQLLPQCVQPGFPDLLVGDGARLSQALLVELGKDDAMGQLTLGGLESQRASPFKVGASLGPFLQELVPSAERVGRGRFGTGAICRECA